MGEDTRIVQKNVEYEIVTHEGKEARKYPNGVIRSPKGYIVYLPAEVAKQRKDQAIAKARISAEEAIARGTESDTPEEGWGKILRARIDVALNDKGRAGNDAARLVGIALGFLQKESKTEIEGVVQHKTVPEIPAKYYEYLEKWANRDVIDGNVSDVSDE